MYNVTWVQMMKTFLALLCLVLISSFSTSVVNADLILDSFQDANWDRVLEPGGSVPVTFRVSSDQVSPIANQLNAFSVGLRIVPRDGAVGSIAILGVNVPDTNPVFLSYAIPPALNDLGGGLQTISGDNAAFQNVSVPGSGLALFQARFFSPGNTALGTFDIFADRLTTSYFTTTEFDGLKFSNVQAAGNPQGVLLGSMHVTATPEPATVILATGSLTACVLARRRRRRRESKT